jgi:hypothetical protein
MSGDSNCYVTGGFAECLGRYDLDLVSKHTQNLSPHPEEACKAVSKGEGASKAARHILRDAHFVGSSG